MFISLWNDDTHAIGLPSVRSVVRATWMLWPQPVERARTLALPAICLALPLIGPVIAAAKGGALIACVTVPISFMASLIFINYLSVPRLLFALSVPMASVYIAVRWPLLRALPLALVALPIAAFFSMPAHDWIRSRCRVRLHNDQASAERLARAGMLVRYERPPPSDA